MKKYIVILLLAVMLCTSLYGASALAVEATDGNFDDSYVLTDLSNALVFNKPFDISDYPKDEKGELRLLEFTEWCFSTKFDLRYNYGLYLYVYNPQCLVFVDNMLNKIEIATEYNVEGEPIKYEKFNLKICNATADNLFYKLKVCNTNKIQDRVSIHPNERQYDVAGLELATVGATNAHDYKVGGTWVYTGYAQGCHASSEEESTLEWEIKSLTTIELSDLNFTVYRTWQNTTWADQLTSVYFSVPDTIVRDYDVLYSIQAETYQYLTAPIFCVYDRAIWGENALLCDYEQLYKDLWAQRGIPNPKSKNKDHDRILCWDEMPGDAGEAWGYFSCYNTKDNLTERTLDTLAWIFQVSEKEDFSVTSDRLMKYMTAYSNEFGKEINGKYSKDLFSDFYYAYYQDYPEVKNGYLPLDIDISGEFDFSLVGATSKYDFWKALFGKWNGNAETEPITPIVEVTYSELSGLSNEQISEKYFVNLSDVGKFKEFVRNQTERRTYLFRFAKSDYYTTPVANNYGIVGYMAQEVAYLDFDIISMGYSRDGVVTIIPVVCNPIDIIGGVEPGKDIKSGLDLVKLILGIIIVVLVILLVVKIIGWLFSKKDKNNKNKE